MGAWVERKTQWTAEASLSKKYGDWQATEKPD